jgi:hypothetical protein
MPASLCSDSFVLTLLATISRVHHVYASDTCTPSGEHRVVGITQSREFLARMGWRPHPMWCDLDVAGCGSITVTSKQMTGVLWRSRLLVHAWICRKCQSLASSRSSGTPIQHTRPALT